MYILIQENPKAFLFDKQIPYTDIIEKNINEIKKEMLDKEVKSLMFNTVETL